MVTLINRFANPIYPLMSIPVGGFGPPNSEFWTWRLVLPQHNFGAARRQVSSLALPISVHRRVTSAIGLTEAINMNSKTLYRTKLILYNAITPPGVDPGFPPCGTRYKICTYFIVVLLHKRTS